MTWVNTYGFPQGQDAVGFAPGFARSIQYGTTANVVRAMNVGKQQNFTQRLVGARANPFSRPADETDEMYSYVSSVAAEQNLNPSQFQELRRDARFFATADANMFEQDVRDQAAFIAKRDETLAGVGVGAHLAAGFLDPTDLAVALGTGIGVGVAARTARLANATNFIATRPFTTGAVVEAGAEAAMQQGRGVLSGRDERDVAGIFAAGLFGGAGSALIARATTKELRQLEALSALNPNERKVVQMVNSMDAAGTQPVRVFGQDTPLGSVMEWLSPRRSAQMSKLSETSTTARLLGGILQETDDGRIVAGAPEMEAEVRLLDADDQLMLTQMSTRVYDAIADLDVDFDQILFAIERARRFKIAGKELTADDLGMDQVTFQKLKPEIDRSAADLDEFYERKRVLVEESGIYQSDILSNLTGSLYAKRAFDWRRITALDDIMEREKMHRLVTGAIVAKQGLPKEYIARKAALGEIRINGVRLADDINAESIDFKTRFILRNFDAEVTKKAQKYMNTLGKAYYDNVVNRLRGARDGRSDYFTSDDLDEEIVADLLSTFNKDASELEVREMAELVSNMLSRKTRPNDKRPDADFLNAKLDLDDTYSVPLKSLGFNDADVARLSQQLDEALGSERISRGDNISFEDLLVTDAFNLANSTRWGANRLSVLGKRGVLGEDDTVMTKVNRMKKEFEDYREKAKKRGVSPKSINREKHRVNRGIFDLMTASGRNPQRAYELMIDVDPVTRSQVAGFDTWQGQIANGARNLTTAIFLPQVLFAQIPEFAQVVNVVGMGGVRFWNDNFKVISDLRRAVRTGKFDSETARDMVYVAGIDPTNSMFRFDRPDMNMRANGKSRAAQFYNISSRVRDVSMTMNLLKPITLQMRTLAYRRSLYNLHKSANGQANPFDEYDLGVLFNLPEGPRRDLAFKLINDFAEIDDATGAVVSLRTDRWHEISDEASALADDMELRLNEFAHRIVQESSMGMSPAMLQGGLLKYFTQFMTYSLNSFEKQLVPLNARVRSGNAAKARIIAYGGIGASMMMYLSKLYISTLGMSEKKRRERFEKGLNPLRVAQMSVSYIPAVAAPMTFIAPALQVLNNAGQGTQISRGAIPTAPTLQAVTGLIDSVQGAKRLVTGDPTEYSTTQLLRYITLGASQLPYVVPVTNTVSASLAGEAPTFGPRAMTPLDEGQ